MKSRATELLFGSGIRATIPLPKTLKYDNDQICWQLVGLETNKYAISEFYVWLFHLPEIKIHTYTFYIV